MSSRDYQLSKVKKRRVVNCLSLPLNLPLLNQKIRENIKRFKKKCRNQEQQKAAKTPKNSGFKEI